MLKNELRVLFSLKLNEPIDSSQLEKLDELIQSDKDKYNTYIQDLTAEITQILKDKFEYSDQIVDDVKVKLK